MTQISDLPVLYEIGKADELVVRRHSDSVDHRMSASLLRRDDIRQISSDRLAFAIADRNGYAYIQLFDDGTFDAPNVSLSRTIGKPGLIEVDEHGYGGSMATTSHDSSGDRENSGKNRAIGHIAMSSMQQVAHRGVWQNDMAPQDSLDSMRLAARCGFEVVKFDLQITSDGEYVVQHDSTINGEMVNAADNSKIDGAVVIKEHTLDDLRSNYVYDTPHKKMQRPIVMLSEILDACRFYGLYPSMDLKNNISSDAEVHGVVDLAVSKLGAENFNLCGFHFEALEKVRAYNAEVDLTFISSTPASTVQKAAENKPAKATIKWNTITQATVQEAREKGVPLQCWEPGHEKFNEMLELGVDIYSSNLPCPNINGQALAFVDHSDGRFGSYDTDGTVVDETLALSEGQSATITGPSAFLGAYYLALELDGNAKLTAPNINNADIAGPRYRTQSPLYSQTAVITITAAAGGVTITEASFAVAIF